MLLCSSNLPFLINLKEKQAKEICLFKLQKNDTIKYILSSNNDDLLLFVTKNANVHLYNLKHEKLTTITDNFLNNDSILSIAFSNDSVNIAISTLNKKLLLYDTNTMKNITILDFNISLKNILFTSNPENIIGSSLNELFLINTKLKKVKAELFKFEESINSIKISPFFTSLIAIGLSNGEIRLVDLESSSVKFVFKDICYDEIVSIAFSPINKMLLVSISKDNKIIFFDVILHKHIKTFDTNIAYNCLSFFIDGKTIACGGENGLVHIYDLSKGKDPILKYKLDTSHDVTFLDFTKSINKQYEIITENRIINEEPKEDDSLSLKDINLNESIKKLNYSDYAKEEEKKFIDRSIIDDEVRINQSSKLTKEIDTLIKKELSDVRLLIHNEMRSVKLEMLKQFQFQESQVKNYFEKTFEYYNNLLKEKLQLEEENLKLKKNYFY